MHIDSHFDSGNIEVVEILDNHVANLRIKKDAGDEHMQWFHFRLDGAQDQACTLRITNAGEASYPKAWEGYRVCTSIDRRNWTRVDTEFEDGVLTINHHPEGQMQWYAYFAPHSHEQHLSSNVGQPEHDRGAGQRLLTKAVLLRQPQAETQILQAHQTGIQVAVDDVANCAP